MIRIEFAPRTVAAFRYIAAAVVARLHSYDADVATETMLLPDYVAEMVDARWPALADNVRAEALRLVECLAVAMWEGPR